MLDNPIFRRELAATARSGMFNALAWAYLLLLAGLLLALWPREGVLSAVSESGRQMFALFFSINLTLLILLTPALTATAITFERENNTFHALFATLLTPAEIIGGKLAAALAKILFVVALSTPMAAMCALTGGISLAFLGQALSILLAAAVAYGMVGLACSAALPRSYSAILASYAAILLLAGGVWLPGPLLGNLVGMHRLWQAVRSASPYDALFHLLYPAAHGMTASVDAAALGRMTPYNVFMAAAGGVSLLSAAFFCWRLAGPDAVRGEAAVPAGAGGAGGAGGAARRRLSWPFYILDPLKRKKPIGRWANPVFVAEMRGKLFANPRFVIRTVCAIFAASLALLTLIALQFGQAFAPDTARVVAIVFQLGVVALLAPGVSSGLITDERAAGTFQALRLTPMSPLTIALGKLEATFFYALIFVASSFFVIFSMAYMEDQNVFPTEPPGSGAFWAALASRMAKASWWGGLWATYSGIFIWIAILAASTAAFLAAGLFASAFSNTTGSATALSYTIIAALCVVTLAPMVLGGRLAPGLAAAMLSLNPVAAAVQATSDALPGYPRLWAANLAAMAGLTSAFLTAAAARIWWLFRRQD